MPIRGLSEQRRIPRLGKIRLGIKKQSARTGNWYPVATDYFVVPEEVAKVFGEKPTEIEIMFPIEDEDKFAPQFYKSYDQSFGLKCKGTGVKAVQRFDLLTGNPATKDSKETSWRDVDCAGRDCPVYQAKGCTEVMNLQFLIPKVPGLGVWQLDTGSFYGILEINSSIELIRSMCGRIAGIPLLLKLAPQEVTPEGEKKKTVHVLKLSAPVTWQQAQQIAQLPMSRCLLPPPDESEIPLLTGPEDELLEKADRMANQAPMPPEELASVEADLWPSDEPPTQTAKAPVKPTIIDQVPEPPDAKAKARKEADDDFNRMESAAPKATPKPPRDPGSIKNLGELMQACKDDFKMTTSQVLAELNVKSLADISITPAEAYFTVRRVKEAPPQARP